MTVSEQLRREIVESGWSSNALGLSCGLSPRIIQAFVAGKRSITSDSLDKIAEALHLRLVKSETPKARRKR